VSEVTRRIWAERGQVALRCSSWTEPIGVNPAWIPRKPTEALSRRGGTPWTRGTAAVSWLNASTSAVTTLPGAAIADNRCAPSILDPGSELGGQVGKLDFLIV
jgi:hypothetical protein